MSYKIMTYDPIDIGWEDDSFADGWGWTPAYVSVNRDGDIVEIITNIGYAGGAIEKTGFTVDAATYKYLVICVRGIAQRYTEIYDGTWKWVEGSYQDAPSDYEVIIYDLSGITTGTVTGIRLGVYGGELKYAWYDFVAFFSVQPQFCIDKVLNLYVRQRESDVDEFELIGTDDIGSGLTIGRQVRIWLKGSVDIRRKVFAGVVEEATPEDMNGRVYRASGRCFGQKLLIRTKSKTFNTREVSLAVKDFVEDLSEVTKYQVETPSPSVYITKDFRYEYIMDGLRDLAKQAGSDWEVKLGMGQDLRFRSRASSNVPSLPLQINESAGNILRNVRKETDGYRAYNKVTVLGGEMSNIDGDVDKYTDEGDIANWSWQVFSGGYIEENAENIAVGKRSIHTWWTNYVNAMESEFDLGAGGIDLRLFRYARFMHRSTDIYGTFGIQGYPQGTTWYFQLRLKDTAYRNASYNYLISSTQPPREFAEVICDFNNFTCDSNFDWQHVRWVQLRVVSNRTSPGEGVLGHYFLDKFHFYTPNITKSATTTNDFRHTREYVHRDEKLVDPGFIQEVANALLNVLKNKENRFKLPLIGLPCVQVGYKANVVSPTHGLNGDYYIVEAEHQLTRNGYNTEMVLESPKLYLETLLTQVIERKIKLLERGGIA